MTYKGVMGFSPVYAYVGNEGYMLDAELRQGEQHCQNAFGEILRNNISISSFAFMSLSFALICLC